MSNISRETPPQARHFGCSGWSGEERAEGRDRSVGAERRNAALGGTRPTVGGLGARPNEGT